MVAWPHQIRRDLLELADKLHRLIGPLNKNLQKVIIKFNPCSSWCQQTNWKVQATGNDFSFFRKRVVAAYVHTVQIARVDLIPPPPPTPYRSFNLPKAILSTPHSGGKGSGGGEGVTSTVSSGGGVERGTPGDTGIGGFRNHRVTRMA